MSRPIDTVNQLVDAINRGDLDRAVAAYEPTAVMVAQPGKLAHGVRELREALTAFIALRPVLVSQEQEVIEVGEVALYQGRWSLKGTDPAGKPVTMAGESADILRRQHDGSWLVVLDNPWGAQTLGPRP